LEAFEEQVVLFLQNLFSTIGWWGVVVAMAIESACIPLPSEVTMPLSGWMLIQAKGLSVWHNIWAGFYGALGCTIGSVITYWIGALGGRPILERYGKYVLISKHDIGEHWREVREVMRPFDIPIAVALLALLGWYIYRHVKRHQEHEALSEATD